MKVYCGDCKYFHKAFEPDFDQCRYYKNGEFFDCYDKIYFDWAAHPKSINRNNGCEWFTPKWYRKGKYRETLQ